MSKKEERNLDFDTCKLIEIHMKQKGMSRVKLAKEIGVSYSYIFNIQTGRRRCVSYKILKSIADVLAIDLHILLGEVRLPETKMTSTFEALFFNSDINIEGHELSFKQKLNSYEILKTLAKPELSRSKKLEHIISALFEQKEDCTPVFDIETQPIIQ
jgi:transcriptional regulator with XRE-family HTH domain